MERDIAPELLEKVLESFDDGIKTSPEFKWALNIMESKSADYKTAHEFSKEVGRILSESYKLNITSETLPNGKMYFNIADRVVRPTMEKAHEIVSDYATNVQTQLNYNVGLKIKGLQPEINDDKIYGIVDKLTTVEKYEDIAWVLDEPIKNFCQSIVENTIDTNVKHHHKLGLKPKIVRISSGKCCSWCDKLAGTYKYPDVPKDVYRRHLRCDCIVDYHPGDGTKTNVHTKKSTNVEKNSKIEKRKLLSTKPKVIKKDDILTNNFSRGSGKNYPIKFIGADHVRFASDKVEKVTVFAGKDVKTSINESVRLEMLFREPKNRWQKISGETFVFYNGERMKVEIHWYEANGKRYLIKVKRRIDNES